MGSPAAVVIDFVSMANQAHAVTAIFVASRNEKERCVTRQTVAKSASPQRAREALRDKIKNCCTGLTYY